MEKLRTLIITFLFFLALLFGCWKAFSVLDSFSSSKLVETTIELKKWKDKDSLNNARANVITAENGELKSLIHSKDSTIAALAKRVKKGTLTVGNHETETINSTSGTTEIVKGDTCSPVYKTHIKDQWQDIKIVASKDSINIKYKIFNSFDYTIEKKGDSTFVSVRNLNPKTDTKSLKFLVAEKKPSKRIYWLCGGIAIGALSSFLLF